MFLLIVVAVVGARGYSVDLPIVDLISPNYLSVFEKHSGNLTLTDKRNFINGTLRTECSEDVWNHTSRDPNSTLSWQIESSGKLDFEYGSLDLQVKLPIVGTTSVDIGLYTTLCPQNDCSKVRKMSTGVSFYLTNVSRKYFDVFVFYPDRHSNKSSQLYIESYTYDLQQPREDQNGYRLIQLVWSENFVTWNVDGVVVNFTDQITLPVGRHILNFNVVCAKETALQPSQEAAFCTAKAAYRKPPDQEKRKPDMQIKTTPPNTLDDYWSSQETVVYLHSYNDEVVIYFDHIRKVPSRENEIYVLEDIWVYHYIKDVWAYLRWQYGPLHQRGESVLYAIFREGKSQRCYTSLQHETLSDRRSILVCGSNDPVAWSWDKRNLRSKFDIGLALSYFAVWGAEGIQGNPNLPTVDKALQDIVAYDMFLALNQTIQTGQLIDQRSNLSTSFPSNESHWLRDWLFPLYHKYGGAQVLSHYFKVLAQNYPTVADDNGIIRYKRNITSLGECVHFWSGAANESLKNLTRNAFGRSTQDDKDLKRAQKEFPNVHYPREMDTEVDAFSLNDELKNVSSRTNVKLLAGILVPALFIAALVTVVVYLCRRRSNRFGRHRQARREVATDTRSYGFLVGKELARFVVSKTQLQRSMIVLGRGEFGTVYAAVASGLRGLENEVPVAAKVLNTRLIDDDRILKALFEQEVRTMVKAGQHLNLVNLLGIVAGDSPTLLLELCELGSLLSCLGYVRSSPSMFVNELDEDGEVIKLNLVHSSNLKSSLTPTSPTLNEPSYCTKKQMLGTVTTSDLLDFAYQSCRGLEYLSSKNIVHRDVAARNVLLTKSRLAKISDFGMARLHESSYVHSNARQMVPMPVRWMAPEALSSLSFCESTDVWSYGVLAWEIFSLGLVPYSNMSIAGRISEFEKWLKDGNCLDKPSYCPAAMYGLMEMCWSLRSDDRPAFSKLIIHFETVLLKGKLGRYVELDGVYQRVNFSNSDFGDPSTAADEVQVDPRS